MPPLRLFGGRPVSKEERQLALRIAAIFAVPMALIMVIPLIIAFVVYRNEVQNRLDEDRSLLAEVRQERIERTRALNEFVYQRCIQDEIRDVVIVQQLNGAILRAKATLAPGSALLRNQLEVLGDGIAALEPPNEPDCTPPPAVKREGAP